LASAARPNLAVLDLYHLLRETIVRKPNTGTHIAIADSKALYKPGSGLAQLERGFHAALHAIKRPASRWSTLVDSLAADPHNCHQALPWHDGFDCALPIDAPHNELSRLGQQLSVACTTSGVRPIAVRARLVFPAEFNELTEHYGTKGAALSHVTIGLLREVMDCVSAPPAEAGSPPPTSDLRPPASFHVVCDKHGGRNRYHSLLQHHFSDEWIDTLVESRAVSRYHWGSSESGVEVAFRTGGESFMPAALASMTAKYLRELSMRAWNQFWCARVPGLRPTAGYPLDARRFKTEIEPAQRELQIDDHVLWRRR
jgi:hypothetical protein